MNIQKRQQQKRTKDNPLILPFPDLDTSLLLLFRGNAAHLGELARAGLSVPEGFSVTTAACVS